MAKVSSGSFKTTGYEGRCLKFEWWTNSRNPETNKTNIGYKVTGADGTDGYWYYSAPFEVIINGQKVYSSSTRIKLYKGTIVTSGTLDIEHTSDGSKSFSASVRGAIYSSAYNCSGSSSWDLVDIPRASKLTGGSGDIGKETTININRASSSFTHTIKYYFGSLEGTIVEKTTDTSIKWTIPTEFYSAIPNNKYGEGTLVCYTYNGNTLIGTSELKYTANVTNSNPVAGTFTYEDTNAVTKEITEGNQLIIRNNSILLFNIGTASAKNSATISKYEVTFNGVTQALTKAGSLDFGIINLSNNSKAILKITDSRGFTATKEIEVKMLDWEIPKGIVSAKRKNNFYSETALKVDGTYSSLNGKNTLALQYIIRRVDEKNSSYDGNLEDNKETIVELDNNYQWHIQFFISDRLGQSTYNVYIDRGIPLIFFDRLLNAVGINKFPSDGFKLDIDGDARGKNLPISTGINTLESFDDVGSGGLLFKSGLYSVCVDNIWYHLLNIRHRNGYTDGVSYGLQIRCRFTIGSPLEYRQQNNGTWTEWKTLNEKNIITAKLGSNYTVKANDVYEILPLTQHLKIGNKFSVNSSGQIVVGSGVSYVKISCSMRHRSGSAGGKYITIHKNSSQVMQIICQRYNTTGFISMSGSDGILSVVEGDTIDARVYGTANDSIGGGNALITYITVEEIN